MLHKYTSFEKDIQYSIKQLYYSNISRALQSNDTELLQYILQHYETTYNKKLYIDDLEQILYYFSYCNIQCSIIMLNNIKDINLYNNKYGNSLLLYISRCSFMDYIDKVKLLLKYGASPYIKNISRHCYVYDTDTDTSGYETEDEIIFENTIDIIISLNKELGGHNQILKIFKRMPIIILLINL